MKNKVFTSGNYFLPIPVGLPAVFVYNSEGILEGVHYWDLTECILSIENSVGVEYDSDLLKFVYRNNIVPSKIQIVGGTTFVFGVMIIKNTLEVCGCYPESVLHIIREEIDSDGAEFYAAAISSYATNILGASSMQTSLHYNRFKMLDGKIVPTQIDNEQEYVRSESLKLGHRFCMAYLDISVTQTNVIYADLNIKQVMGSLDWKLNEYGVVMSTIHFIGGTELLMNYNQAKSFDIRESSLVVMDSFGIISTLNSHNHNVFNEYEYCRYCGRLISQNDIITRCADEHCMTRSFHDVNHFMKTLHLQEFSYEAYDQYILSSPNSICRSVIDVLDIYSTMLDGTLDIQVSLSTLMRAIIPKSKVSSDQVVSLFVTACRNTIQSILHYIHNPARLITDFDFGKLDVRELVDWISDEFNVKLVERIFDNKFITIVDTDKLLSGVDPILRNTHICITGRFNVGNYSDVVGILGSYGATVDSVFNENTRYVIVGDKKEDIDNVTIQSAQNNGCAVVSEGAFFEHFQIYDDLKMNLL